MAAPKSQAPAAGRRRSEGACLHGVQAALDAADALDGDDVAAVDAAERRQTRVDRLVNHLRAVHLQRWRHFILYPAQECRVARKDGGDLLLVDVEVCHANRARAASTLSAAEFGPFQPRPIDSVVRSEEIKQYRIRRKAA